MLTVVESMGKDKKILCSCSISGWLKLSKYKIKKKITKNYIKQHTASEINKGKIMVMHIIINKHMKFR